MSKTIAIDKLTNKEKIDLMEKLWADLSSSKDYSPPDWHGKELQKRQKLISEGKVKYSDWDEAKEDIKREIS